MVFNKSQHSIDKFWSYWTTSKRMILWGVKDYCCLWLTREFYFLRNRQARVRLNGETSKSKNFKQGLPQGAVLSPLLFMFFINNLAESLPNPDTQQLTSAKLIYSMFADDCTILASHAKREKANEAAQLIVDMVVK